MAASSHLQELEAALRQSEGLTRGVIDSLAAHVAVLNPRGDIIITNAAWDRFARENSPGTPRNTGVGANYLRVCSSACGNDSEGATEAHAGIQRLLAGEVTDFYLEYPCHSPTEQRWFLLQASRLRGGFDGAVLLHINITERKLMEGKLLEHEKLKVLSTGLLTGQEEERKRIARELHDGLNQRVAALAIELGMLVQRVEDPELGSSLKDLQTQTFSFSDQVRRISHRLHPASLEYLGIVPALRSFCTEFSRLEKLPVQFVVHENSATLSEQAALCVYRIAQECLRNTAKHAGATSATVEFSADSKGTTLLISDNGRGFDFDALGPNRGLGLVSMEERVKLIGGCFELSSERGCGTSVRVRLPAS